LKYRLVLKSELNSNTLLNITAARSLLSEKQYLNSTFKRRSKN
jgi:hypothetical protein